MESYQAILEAKAAAMNRVELDSMTSQGLAILHKAASTGLLEDKAMRLILVTVANLMVELAIKDITNFKMSEHVKDDPELQEIKERLGL